MPEIVKKQLSLPLKLTPTFRELREQSDAAYYTLNQDEYWVDIQGQRWKLREMASSHLSNLKGYLIRGADYFFMLYSMGEASQQGRWIEAFGAPDDFDIPSVLDDFVLGSEKQWIQTTKLVKRIDKILEQRHRGVSFGEVVGG